MTWAKYSTLRAAPLHGTEGGMLTLPRNPFILLENFFAGKEPKWEKPNGKDDCFTGGAGHKDNQRAC